MEANIRGIDPLSTIRLIQSMTALSMTAPIRDCSNPQNGSEHYNKGRKYIDPPFKPFLIQSVAASNDHWKRTLWQGL